ncbi:stalk domain-containing protein [Deinococcus sp. YIM 77859]|uniref:stalk domain-containing protein n=1 Tax=Deinococcus sp. YIM 77859 TaxID=1540221 RepID=UPI000555B99F|nr:stalk domain-containing protein [Deinococcus sp. YIM 77859]
MKRLLLLSALTFSATAGAQPSYFSRDTVRDDIARRIGAYEISCDRTPVHREDVAYSSCMVREGGGAYPKSVIDIWYSEYMDGGWRFIDTVSADTWIRNTLRKDGRSLSINVIESNDITYVTVYDISLAVAVEDSLAKAALNRKAGPLGATPNTTYVTLGQLKPAIASSTKGKNYTLSVNGQKLEFTLGGRTAKLNGKPARLNATPFFMDGATYFPLAAVQLLGCKMQPPDGLFASVTCGNNFTLVEYNIFSTDNPPATALQPSLASLQAAARPAATPRPAATAAAGAGSIAGTPEPFVKPAGAVTGVPYTVITSVAGAGTLDVLANESYRLNVAGQRLTFEEGKKVTAEGVTLPAAPYVDNDVMFVPVNSLKSLGCTVTITSTQFRAECPGGTSIDGTQISW